MPGSGEALTVERWQSEVRCEKCEREQVNGHAHDVLACRFCGHPYGVFVHEPDAYPG